MMAFREAFLLGSPPPRLCFPSCRGLDPQHLTMGAEHPPQDCPEALSQARVAGLCPPTPFLLKQSPPHTLVHLHPGTHAPKPSGHSHPKETALHKIWGPKLLDLGERPQKRGLQKEFQERGYGFPPAEGWFSSVPEQGWVERGTTSRQAQKREQASYNG